MISKKVSSLVFITLITISVIASLFFALPVRAQEESAALMCPINGSFSITSDLVGKTTTVEDSLTAAFTLENGTAYFLPEIKVGVGFYTSDTATVPSYWTVLPNSVSLQANTGASMDVDLNLSAIPEGEYIARLFIGQGTETAIFGAALRDFNTPTNFEINKVTPSTANISLNTNLNGGATALNNTLNANDSFLLEATAKNNGNLPVTNAKLTAVLIQGDIALAGAVILETTNNLKLIPNGQQTIKLTNSALTEGDYSAYVLIGVENSLQAVDVIKLKVGERAGGESWPYISLLGISDFPTTDESEVVACVNYLGLGAEARQLHSTLGVEFIGTVGQTEVLKNKVSNLSGSEGMFFSQKIGELAQGAKITVKLLEDTTGNLMYVGTEPEGVEVAPIDYLVPTQSIEVILSCPPNTVCETDDMVLMEDNNYQSGSTESFWFYAGVVLAALLLMYLMLRRLHPEDSHLNGKLSDSELQ